MANPPPIRRRRHSLLFGGIVLLLFALALLSLCAGSTPIGPRTVAGTLLGHETVDPAIRIIVVEYRIPRILTALFAGGALAAAGLLMQTVFRNPLADPFVLGVNSGASLGVALVLLLLAPAGISIAGGLGVSGQLLLILASTGGAAATLFCVLLLSRKVDAMSVLIIGLMISYTVGALVSVLMFFSMAERLQAFVNWSFGDYGNVGWPQMRVFAPAILLGLGAGLALAKPLDALLLGEHYAQSLGTRVRPARLAVLLAASVLAGTVTGFCGPIGFLGVAAPHLCRQLFHTAAHRLLVPASILVGALLSLFADFLARGPGLDTSLPLNAITALIGAPVIVAALVRRRKLKPLF